MTDFGRRLGSGDMLKSVYDANDDGVVDEVPGHKTSHQDAGSDEIAVTGLVGATPRAILGDATAGRVYRHSYIYIQNGTSDNTIKCSVASYFNGDAIAETDNIAKDATTGNFSLGVNGRILKILATGLTGTPIDAVGTIHRNKSGTPCDADVSVSGGAIQIVLSDCAAGAQQDLTALVESDFVLLGIRYLTSE